MPDPDPQDPPKPPEPASLTLLIVNEHSRSGRERGDEAEASLKAAGLEVLRGHTTSREGVSQRIRELAGEIETRRQRSGNADGEIVTRTPAMFRILQNAVTVYTPS